jgi:beta-lactamase superfamily II metal-dependent hydrolase
MSRLNVTLIDVGWGDSILVEAIDGQNRSRYALIDSNDTATYRSSFIFLKRFFELKMVDLEARRPLFDFVLLTHDHTDHGQGLQAAISAFGTDWLWYPKAVEVGDLATLIRYAKKYPKKVGRYQAIDLSKELGNLGPVSVRALWPPYDHIERKENDNSVVLELALGSVSFVLTGDAEAKVWDTIAGHIPAQTQVFKVPHHGSVNGAFSKGGATPWMDRLSALAPGPVLGISCHIRPHTHPDAAVVKELDARGLEHYRTDQHYHVTFSTDGTSGVTVKYSHA